MAETWSPLQERLLRAAQDVVFANGPRAVDPADFQELKEVVQQISDEAAAIIRAGVKDAARKA